MSEKIHPENPSLLDSLKELLIKPQKFFKENIKTDFQDMPFFEAVIFIFFLSKGINRLEKVLTKSAYWSGNYNDSFFATDWMFYWVLVVVAWVIAWYIYLLIWSWFYNLRIKWSKWEDSPLLAKKIYLYSWFFVALIAVLITIWDTIFYSSPIEVYNFEGTLSTFVDYVEIFLSILLIVALYHSVYISYKSVMIVKGINKFRAMIWFNILPIIIYTAWIIILIISLSSL